MEKNELMELIEPYPSPALYKLKMSKFDRNQWQRIEARLQCAVPGKLFIHRVQKNCAGN